MAVGTAASDRLPWLTDDVPPRAASTPRNGLAPWATGALGIAALGGAWLGISSVDNVQSARTRARPYSMTLELPPARGPVVADGHSSASQETGHISVPPLQPASSPQFRVAPALPRKSEEDRDLTAHTTERFASRHNRGLETSNQTASGVIKIARAVRPVRPRAWRRPARARAGRIVEIGAFGSAPQARKGWSLVVHRFPAMERLPTAVKTTTNSKGRPFYRFEIATGSPARSQRLCQRMQDIDLSCAVHGVRWKATEQ